MEEKTIYIARYQIIRIIKISKHTNHLINALSKFNFGHKRFQDITYVKYELVIVLLKYYL